MQLINTNTIDNVACVGKGMDYLPAASALAATNCGKMKNLRMSAIRSAEDPRACILQSEKETPSYDAVMKKTTQGEALQLSKRIVQFTYLHLQPSI